MNSVFIATPSYTGHRDDLEQVCFEKMQNYKSPYYKIEHSIIFSGGALISGIRKYLMEEFFKTKSTHLLFVDADIAIIQPNSLEILIKHRHSIVSPVVTTRTLPLGLIYDGYKGDETDLKRLQDGKLFKVSTVGMAFMLIERECLERIQRHAELNNAMAFQPMMYEGKYEGEDGAFCRRAAEIGFSIWLDPNIIIGHVGKYPFTKFDFLNYWGTEKGIKKDK